jgi:hypothetical protein
VGRKEAMMGRMSQEGRASEEEYLLDRGSMTYRGVSPACMRVVGILKESELFGSGQKSVCSWKHMLSTYVHVGGGCAKYVQEVAVGPLQQVLAAT